ncbi:MAG: hypothetical protein FWF59_04280 [Turicibacter sp.]|nr:hypothetical protein [Turicibacter sp.]
MKLNHLSTVAWVFFPICVAAAVFVYTNRFGWDYFWLEIDLYGFMAVGSVIAYYLIRKSTLLFGNLSLSLWKGESFRQMPVNVLRVRYKISIYFSAIFALVAFVGGIMVGNDLFVLFSWTILGFTVSSEELSQLVEAQAQQII